MAPFADPPTNPNRRDTLISVLLGKGLDVAVDVRLDSPTFGRHFGVEFERGQPPTVLRKIRSTTFRPGDGALEIGLDERE